MGVDETTKDEKNDRSRWLKAARREGSREKGERAEVELEEERNGQVFK